EGNDVIKMATSILDYIFRELAVSYLGRNDLAHVEPADLMPDTIGKGIAAESSNLREIDDPAQASVGAEAAAIVQKVASQGYMRNKLTVLHGGKRQGATARGGAGEAEMPLFAAGSLAVAAEAIDTVEFATLAADPRVEKIREARMKGYEGDSCGECGNFTLV